MKTVSRFLCCLAWAMCLGGTALAASTDLTDVPLRTASRAKPNILLLIDNGANTQQTNSPEKLYSNVQTLLTSQVKAHGKFDNGTIEYLYKFFGTGNLTSSNSTSNADTDWHYRASGKYAALDGAGKPQSCTATGICTLTSVANSCPASICTDVFNQQYYDPTNAYAQPKDANGVALPLPQTTYAGMSAPQAANCNCPNLAQCAWLDGFNPSAGCVDLSRNFSTAPYPYTATQMLPWSQRGAYPPSSTNRYLPILSPLSSADGTITHFLVDTTNTNTHAPVLPPGALATDASALTDSNNLPILSPQPVPTGGGSASGAVVSGSTNPFTGWYSYHSPIGTTFSFPVLCTVGDDCPAAPGTASSYYPPGCTVDTSVTTGLSCSTGGAVNACPALSKVSGTVSLTNLWCPLTQSSLKPIQLSSPVYCDTASQWPRYPAPYPGVNGQDNDPANPFAMAQACQDAAIAGAPVYTNPGPADFFDPDGTRHVITKATDQAYFYTSTTDEAQNRFAIWHSFWRTRLLALKSALNLSIGDTISGNFRVGLAAMASPAQGTSTPAYSFGACSDATNNAACHYFSPVADFADGLGPSGTWNHKSEWYTRLKNMQTAPLTLANNYTGYLNTAYRWFAGVGPDPVSPDTTTYPTQSMANVDFNTGADSQYVCNVDSTGVPQTNPDGTCKTGQSTGRTGPMMYSCQPNALVVFAGHSSGYPPVQLQPPPNLAGTGPCKATDNTGSYSNTSTCDFDATTIPSSPSVWPTASAYGLPPNVLPFCDALLNGIAGTSSCTGGSGSLVYSGGSLSFNTAFPFPLKGQASSIYSTGISGNYGGSALPMNSLSDLALYYWSHDLNQEFNNYWNPTGASPFSGKQVLVKYPANTGFLSVQPSTLDKASWPHVTTYFVNMALASQCDYSGTPYPTATTCDPVSSVWPTPSLATNTTRPSDGSTYSTAVDDMAHAAFNGHGKYLSATGTSDLQTKVFPSLFSSILSLIGSESAVAVANTQVKAGSVANYAFQSFYNSNAWWGDLRASPIDSSTGNILYSDSGTSSICPNRQSLAQGYVCWSAAQQLRNTLCTANCASATIYGTIDTTRRRIISDNGGSSSPGIEFAVTGGTGGLTTDQKNALNTYYLTGPSSSPVYHTRNDTANLVAYLRGDNTNESCVRTSGCGDAAGTACYRCRYLSGTGSLQSNWYPLGDIADAEAVAIATPAFQYGGTYTAFQAANSPATAQNPTGVARTPVIYQAGNDGMLHAFNIGSNGDAAGGNELWAYVPSFVIPNLQALANPCHDLNPSKSCTSHKYFVNATPAFGDVDLHDNDPTTYSPSSADTWRTLLVGGLGKGGRGYYALNVTKVPGAGDAQSDLTAKVLWTFPNSGTAASIKKNVGYSYGRPAIVKVQKDSTSHLVWAVLVSSGYNNGTYSATPALSGNDDPTGTGDGKGHLYVLDAQTGAVIQDIPTPCDTNTPSGQSSCSPSNPSGFAYFSARVGGDSHDPTQDPSVQEVYGGDLLGNVWKFDLTGDPSTWTLPSKVTRLASLFSSTSVVQSVTTEPELAFPDGQTLMVYVGTGRYLGSTDVPSGQALTSRQTVYSLKTDATSATTYTTSTNGARGAIAASHSIDANDSTKFGSKFCPVPSDINRCLAPGTPSSTATDAWLFDLPVGENIITTPLIVLGNLIFTSNTPLSDPCQPGGKSSLYMMDYRNGGMLPGATSMASDIRDPITQNNIMAARPTVIQLPDGRISVLGSTEVGTTLQQANPGSNVTRRISWREVPNL